LIAANGYVHVDTLLAVNKTYPLKFSLWVSPQTGSLADIKGKEGVNFEDSTVLYLRFVDAQ
jgi:hypothetical protein